MILVSENGNEKVFHHVPIICFKINKKLKAQLVMLQQQDLDMVAKHLDEILKINKNYNYNQKMALNFRYKF